MPTSTARRTRSSSQSINNSANVRVFGFLQNSPIRSALRSREASGRGEARRGERDRERRDAPVDAVRVHLDAREETSLSFIWSLRSRYRGSAPGASLQLRAQRERPCPARPARPEDRSPRGAVRVQRRDRSGHASGGAEGHTQGRLGLGRVQCVRHRLAGSVLRRERQVTTSPLPDTFSAGLGRVVFYAGRSSSMASALTIGRLTGRRRGRSRQGNDELSREAGRAFLGRIERRVRRGLRDLEAVRSVARHQRAHVDLRPRSDGDRPDHAD